MKTLRKHMTRLLAFTILFFAISINANANYKILFANMTQHTACLRIYDHNGICISEKPYYYGNTTTTYWRAIGYNNNKILWTNRGGALAIWNLDDQGNIDGPHTDLPHPGSWIPVSFADRKILFKHSYNGTFAIWTVKEDNSVTKKEYTEKHGTPLFCDGEKVVFKTSSGVHVQLWSLASNTGRLYNPSELFYVGTTTNVRYRRSPYTSYGKLIFNYKNKGKVLTIDEYNDLIGDEQFEGTATHGPFPQGTYAFGTAYWQLIDYTDFKLIWTLTNYEEGYQYTSWTVDFYDRFEHYITYPSLGGLIMINAEQWR